MRIATYNVWNEEDKGVGGRFEQLIEEITNVDADVIGLQEVTTQFFQDASARLTQYLYCEFRTYTGEDEGLAILSKHPISNCTFLHMNDNYGNSNALNVVLQVGEAIFSVTNVHLPWDSIKAKEEQIIAIDRFIHEQKETADYLLLLGDFNCDISSSVHRFLTAEQTLYGNEAKPEWLEISSTFAELHDKPLVPTLDCINNPRWKGKNSIYVPENFDRIYIMDNWNYYAFRDVQVFGTKVSPVNNLCASDHYGVMAEVDFIE